MKLSPGRLLAGSLVVLAVAAPSALATPVTVRVAGETPAAQRGPVAVDTQAGGEIGPDACPNASAGGALDLAVRGSWDRQAFVQTILGETHDFSHNDSWALWINESLAQVGLCQYVPRADDRILLIADRSSPTFMPTVFPLSLAAVPSSVVVGEPFAVTVREHRSDGVTTTAVPVAGATVTVAGGGGTSATSGADGVARLSVGKPGRVSLTATKPGTVSADPVRVAVSAQADERPPVVRIAGLRSGRTYAPASAPRRLRGTVRETGVVDRVELRVTRRAGGRCATLVRGGKRFRPVRCARGGTWFVAGRDDRWSSRLPRLGRGRYVVSVRASDEAGNGSAVRRVRFRVA